MTRNRRTAALAAGVLALVFALTGCVAGSPSAGPTAATSPATSSASPTPAPTAEPVAPLETVGGLVARPEGLELRALGGDVVATFDYMSAPSDAVAALTTVFGAPPVDQSYAGTAHSPAGVMHRWDLFVLDERNYDEVRRQAEGYDWVVWPRFAVYFDGPAADGVILSSVSGVQAGDPWSFAESAPGFDAAVPTCTGTSIEAVTTTVPSDWTGGNRVNVIAMPSDDGSTVKWIGAPEMEADGCA
ncbi:hypothetical protein ACFPPE_00065 [Agromyces tardus]|jgi:hypothetical protein|nr:hypothetical protein [Agromyces tardus]